MSRHTTFNVKKNVLPVRRVCKIQDSFHLKKKNERTLGACLPTRISLMHEAKGCVPQKMIHIFKRWTSSFIYFYDNECVDF